MNNDSPYTVETALSGYELLNDPLLNKGTGFSDDERDAFDLHGLLPPRVTPLDMQVKRRLDAFRGQTTDLHKYVFLRGLQDTNETLFYALLTQNIEEMMPIVYTPTVGLGCQLFSHIFRKPRGLFLSLPHKDAIRRILGHPRFDRVEAIVVSDGERILGLGDQGAGGMGIPIGKLSLYTACAGLHPSTTLPILLDVGTDNKEHLADPLYVGWQHERVRGPEYDALIEMFVEAVSERWPHVLLHWEDFAIGNANRLLARYRDRSVRSTTIFKAQPPSRSARLLSAINVTGMPLERQRVAVLGAGSAGTGICALLARAMIEAGASKAQVHSQFYLVDRDGLLVEGMPGLQPFQAPFVQPRDAIAGWTLRSPPRIDLADVIANTQPTVLIGTSGQAHAFSEAAMRAMASSVQRPIIFPLSNPTERSEATPQDLFAWTEGRAVIGTGSPFPPIRRNGQDFRVDQTNNAYVYPGIGLGAIAAKARRISDGMFLAAARAVAELSPAAPRSGSQPAPAAGRFAQNFIPRRGRRRQASHRRRLRGPADGSRHRNRLAQQDVGAGLCPLPPAVPAV